MSMEEVSMREDEIIHLWSVIKEVRDFATLQPLDLMKPHEIQRGLLAILDKAGS